MQSNTIPPARSPPSALRPAFVRPCLALAAESPSRGVAHRQLDSTTQQGVRRRRLFARPIKEWWKVYRVMKMGEW